MYFVTWNFPLSLRLVPTVQYCRVREKVDVDCGWLYYQGRWRRHDSTSFFCSCMQEGLVLRNDSLTAQKVVQAGRGVLMVCPMLLMIHRTMRLAKCRFAIRDS